MTPPKAIAPCEAMMAVAFIRPRAHPGFSSLHNSESNCLGNKTLLKLNPNQSV